MLGRNSVMSVGVEINWLWTKELQKINVTVCALETRPSIVEDTSRLVSITQDMEVSFYGVVWGIPFLVMVFAGY